MYRELFDLTGRKALVIGAASGIGRAVSQGLREFGAHVIAADKDVKGAAEVGDEAHYVDVTDLSSIRELMSRVEVLHVLVVTPAVNFRKRVEDYTYEEFRKVVDVNLFGAFATVKEAIPALKRSGKGSVVLISSIRAFVVEPGQGPYAMTKAAVVQLVKALAAELAPYGIRANAVAPGIVDTPFVEQIKRRPDWARAYAEKTALRRWASPSEIVGPVILLASDAGSYITGSVITIDGGWTAIDGRFDPLGEQSA
ncbi:MAG: SDR family oxidoreductase [Thaumarchaeota archaeon]|nr:SDR family oxidoreductase [Candidatus Calditenuaceae archaeon]